MKKTNYQIVQELNKKKKTWLELLLYRRQTIISEMQQITWEIRTGSFLGSVFTWQYAENI